MINGFSSKDFKINEKQLLSLKIKKQNLEQPRWLSGLVPPLAQGMILETRNQVPCQASCMEPASSSAYVFASLFVSLLQTPRGRELALSKLKFDLGR